MRIGAVFIHGVFIPFSHCCLTTGTLICFCNKGCVMGMGISAVVTACNPSFAFPGIAELGTDRNCATMLMCGSQTSDSYCQKQDDDQNYGDCFLHSICPLNLFLSCSPALPADRNSIRMRVLRKRVRAPAQTQRPHRPGTPG